MKKPLDTKPNGESMENQAQVTNETSETVEVVGVHLDVVEGAKVSASAFKKHVLSICKSIKSMRGQLQAAIVIAGDHYVAHGNTQYLTAIQQAVDTVHGLPSKGIQMYLQAAFNVQWTKNDSGDRVYKKRRNTEAEGNMPETARCNAEVIATPFYDWLKAKGVGRSQPDWNEDKYCYGVLKILKKNKVDVGEFTNRLRAKAAAQ